jgi:DNA-binding NarL/FixJ family response regulator
MKILVVDDERELLDNVCIVLRLADYEVFQANNGIEALRLAHEQHPDLIICDITMPEMNGYELLDELQGNSVTAAIPFIFLTAKSELEDIRRGMLAGADDYLIKPFAEDTLLDTIQKRFEKRQRWELEQHIRFTRQLVQMQERDFAHIAQTLDEELHQKLLHLKYWVDTQSLNPRAAQETLLDAVQKSVTDLMTQVKRISYHLYPAMLPQLGLVLSLEWYFSSLQNQSNLQVRFENHDMDVRLQHSCELSLYRIVQRVMEHVQASSQEISIVLWRDENTVHLSISELPVFDKDKDEHLFQLLEEYAQGIGASLAIQLDTGSSAIYIMLPHAPLQVPQLHQEISHFALKDTILLAISPSKDFLEQLKVVLNPSFEFIAYQSLDLDAVFRQINLHKPHIIILDMVVSSQILSLLIQRAAVIMLSPNQDESFTRQVLQAGIMGLIPRAMAKRELLPAIQTIMSGAIYVSASLILSNTNTKTKTTLNLELLLTTREREILDLILADLTHADIAAKLVISPRTVEKHRANIMQKLGLNTHTELILFALRHGLISSA